jgi:hypothetical protein
MERTRIVPRYVMVENAVIDALPCPGAQFAETPAAAQERIEGIPSDVL